MKPNAAVIFILSLFVSVLLIAAPADSSVAKASMRGDKQTVRSLLEKGADANAALSDGMTALHWAAKRGDAEIAEMLVYAGANANATTRIGQYTPLHIASREGNAPVVDLLIKAGADVSARTTNSGVTALHLAAASGNVDVVSALLEHGADPNAKEGQWGQTPLIFAAAQNRVDAIKALIRHHADPSVTTKVEDLAMHAKLAEAANARQRSVLASIRTKGDNTRPTPSEVQAAVLAARELYLSGVIPKDAPKDDATGRGQGGVGAGPAIEDERPATNGGMTALLHAARQGYIEAATALLDGGAKIDQVNAGDATSPLLMAIINGQYDTAMLFIKRGANPNLAASINGAAPLWAAVNSEWQPRTRFPQPQEQGLQQANYLDVMEALLKAGASPNARLTRHPWYMVYGSCGSPNCGLEITEGSTAFWRAAYGTDVEAMRLLLKYGADPNIPTKAQAPRSRTGQPETESRNSAQVQRVQPMAPGLWPATDAASVQPDPSGLPEVEVGGPGVFAIHAASGVGYGEGFAGNFHRHAPDAWLSAVKYLIEEVGTDVNARDSNGYTPLHHAAARGDNELILYLVSKGADVKAVARSGQTVADMANGPVQRVAPFPETVALLEKLGSKNSHRCVTC